MPEQMGTLGGGNHFIELQKGDDGHIWIMLHSGSRGIGKMTCDYYNDLAEKLNKQWYSYEAKELAFLPMETAQGMEYIQAMRIGMRFAEENRLHMLEKITESMRKFLPNMEVEEAIDTHHNYASLEHHYGSDYLVHRKGAVRAVGKVIIPGSMGTYSYIGEGLQNPESFWSCSHGAGRRMGRKEATRTFTAQSVIEEMREKDIELYKVKKEDVAEECAAAYKDIDEVMENQSNLVKPLVKLRPIGVVKG
jgi:tRNA-splicing ligase RtcB